MKKSILLFLLSIALSGFSQSNSNWQQMNTNGIVSIIHNMEFVDSINGFALSASNLIETKDAGQNWSISGLVPTSFYLNNLIIKDDSLFIISVDSNSNYGIYSTNINDSLPIASYQITTEDGSYLSSLKSFNGEFWGIDNQNLVVSNNIYSKIIIKNNQIKSFDFFNGYLSCSSQSHIYFSSDTGKTWDSASYNNLQNGINSIQTHYGNSDTVFSIGRIFPASDFISYDKGSNWIYLSQLGIGRKPFKYHFISNKTIIGTYQGVVLTSNDYSVSFNSDTLINNTPSLQYYIYQHSDRIFFFYGHGGVIYKTNNAGGLVDLQEQEKLENQIQIYPNPAKDIIQLNYISDIKIERIELYNLEGKLVKRFANRKQELDISEITSGNYILKLETKTERFSKQVIIQ